MDPHLLRTFPAVPSREMFSLSQVTLVDSPMVSHDVAADALRYATGLM